MTVELSASAGAEAEARPVSRTGSGGGNNLQAWRLAAFAAPCIPVAAMLMPVTVYLPDYYTRDLGLRWSEIGFAFAAVRLFDLWLDPTLGFLIDKTNSRWGRFRPWLVAGLPMAVLAIWMLFMAGPGINGLYILAWLIVGFIGQSMASMAHAAWAARIAPDYSQRSKVYGWWQAFNVIGILLALGMPVLLAKGFGLTHGAGVQAIGWLVMVSLPITIAVALLAMREPPIPRNITPPHWKQYIDLIRRGPVLRLLLTDIAWGTGPVLAGTLVFPYFFAVRGYDRADTGLLLLFYFVGALACAPFWTWVGRRLNKHRTMMIAALVYAAAQLTVLVAPHGFAWGIVTMSLAGIPFTAGPIMLRAMMADVGDHERLNSGVDRTGLLFGLLSGTVKIGSATAVLMAGMLLDGVGFDARLGAANTPEALTTLKLAFALLPAACGLICAWLIAGHKLDDVAHAEIRRRLDERDAITDAP